MPTEIHDVQLNDSLATGGGEGQNDSDSDNDESASSSVDAGAAPEGSATRNYEDESLSEDEEDASESGKERADESRNDEDDDESTVDMEEQTEITDGVDDEDDLTTGDNSTADAATATPKTPGRKRRKHSPGSKSGAGSSVKKSRSPSVVGLTIPFRTVKKAMKLDPGTPIVQNEAAVMATFAAEQFLKTLAKESFRRARNRGRNTIRYEDIAEARTTDKALSFLETLFP